MSGRLPLAFVENRGQWDTPAQYVARRGGMSARLEPGAILLQLEQRADPPAQDATACPHRSGVDDEPLFGRPAASIAAGPSRGVLVRMTFEGSLPSATIEAEAPLPGRYHYLLTNDRSRWQTHVPGFASVLYQGLYDGIDVRVREGSGLEYDLLVAPGADIGQVVVRCEGIEALDLAGDGSLVMQTAMGPVRQAVPATWEELPGGERRPLECRYRLLGSDSYAFDVPARAPSLAMVIDPGLSWSTFLGGNANDGLGSVAIGSDGSITVVGSSVSANFPITPGAYQTSYVGDSDLIVTRLDPTGSFLVFSTIIGGTGTDTAPYSSAADAQGSTIVVGTTKSADFPTTPGAFDTTFNGPAGKDDAFVLGLNAAGSDLDFSTYVGGSTCRDVARAMSLAPDGTILLTGTTCAIDFPTTPGAYKPAFTGGTHDIFVVRMDAAASTLLASTLFGGLLDDDVATVIVEGPSGSVVVAGQSRSDDFPTTSGAYEQAVLPFPPVLRAGFVSRLSADATTLEYSTFIGGQSTQPTQGMFWAETSVGWVVPLSTGEMLIGGSSTAGDLPATPGALQPVAKKRTNGFVGCLDSAGAAFDVLTFFGGNDDDNLQGPHLHPNGDLSVFGNTLSSDLPVTPDAFDPINPGGGWIGYVARIDASLSKVVYCSYLGEPSNISTFAYDMALDAAGAAIVVGTASPFFPTTTGSFQPVHGGGIWDGFVSRIVTDPSWIVLGGALMGQAGRPELTGQGVPCAGEIVTLKLTKAAPVAAAALVIGFSQANLPFKGGTMVPLPSLILFGLATNGAGELTLSATWPPGIPTGFSTVLQYWITDPVGPAGFSASNGLEAIAR